MVGLVFIGTMRVICGNWLNRMGWAEAAQIEFGRLNISGDDLSAVTIFSPLTLLVLISAIIILLYFYKTAEWMNQRRLIIALGVIAALLVAGSFVKQRQDRAPAVKFRLAVLPVQSDSASAASQWMAAALWHMIGQELHRAVADRAIVIPADWLPIDIQVDSLEHRSSLERLHAEYVLVGRIKSEPAAPAIHYQLIHIRSNSVILNEILPLIPEKFPAMVCATCDTILNYFGLPPRSVAQAISYTSIQNYLWLLKSAEQYRLQNFDSAREYINHVIASDSLLVDALVLAGKIYFSMALEKKEEGSSPAEQFELAKSYFTRAIAADSSCAEAWMYLGDYYVYQQRWSFAEQMLLRAYQLQPNLPRLYLSLSRLHPSRYQKLGFKNERQLFERAIFFNPGDEEAYLMLADHYLFENQREQAIRILERFLAIHPNSVPALMALGKIYLVRNDVVKIIEIYHRVLQLQPRNADAYYNLGILYYNSEDYETAEQLLKRAIAINNHANAHVYLAYLYEAKGNLPLAIEHLRERIRLRKGLDDEFAESARNHLYALLHADSTKASKQGME